MRTEQQERRTHMISQKEDIELQVSIPRVLRSGVPRRPSLAPGSMPSQARTKLQAEAYGFDLRNRPAPLP